MRASRASARRGGRASPRASLGCARSPLRSPATASKTPGARTAQRQARGKRSATRLAFHEAAAWRSSAVANAASYSPGRPARIASERGEPRRTPRRSRRPKEDRRAPPRRRPEAHDPVQGTTRVGRIGQPVSSHLGECLRIDAVRPGQAVEVRPEPRPFVQPAADAEVRVISLGKDPAVPARDDARARPRPFRDTDPGRGFPAHVSLERHTAPEVGAEPESAGDDPVRAVRADDVCGLDRSAARPVRSSSRGRGDLFTAAPSLNSTPASVACSARKASSRRRWVMRMTGLLLRRSSPRR